jgi:hypothetical protein
VRIVRLYRRMGRARKDQTPAPVITDAFVRLVAALAQADVRTARRFLEGGDVRGSALVERLTAAKKRAAEINGQAAGGAS